MPARPHISTSVFIHSDQVFRPSPIPSHAHTKTLETGEGSGQEGFPSDTTLVCLSRCGLKHCWHAPPHFIPIMYLCVIHSSCLMSTDPAHCAITKSGLLSLQAVNKSMVQKVHMASLHGPLVWSRPFGPCNRAQTARAPSQYKDRLIYVWRFPC